jgi:hypothetical protein
LPYVLDIDPETTNDLLAIDSEQAALVLDFLCKLQNGPPFPGAPRQMAYNAFYSQLDNRWFVGWDFPEGQATAAVLAKCEVALRVLGFGRTIRTYERGKRVFEQR